MAVAAVYDRRLFTTQSDTPAEKLRRGTATLPIDSLVPLAPDSRARNAISPCTILRCARDDRKTSSANAAVQCRLVAGFWKLNSLATLPKSKDLVSGRQLRRTHGGGQA